MINSVWAFPVAAAILLPGTFFLTYTIAVLNGHVQPLIPYISDTGSYPPESCIFAQFLNMSAVLYGVVMYFRHRQVVEFYRHASISAAKNIRFSNRFLWIGYTSAFGISMVGNCPQTAWLLAHMVGAGLAFGCGLIYCWGQTIFSYKMEEVMHKRWICHVRLFLAFVATVCFFFTCIFGFNPFTDITPQRASQANDCALWQLVFILPGEQGYIEHQITTGCEWGMALVFTAYFATYAVELRHAYLLPPILKLRLSHSLLPIDPDHQCDSMMTSLMNVNKKIVHSHVQANIASPDAQLKVVSKKSRDEIETKSDRKVSLRSKGPGKKSS